MRVLCLPGCRAGVPSDVEPVGPCAACRPTKCSYTQSLPVGQRIVWLSYLRHTLQVQSASLYIEFPCQGCMQQLARPAMSFAVGSPHLHYLLSAFPPEWGWKSANCRPLLLHGCCSLLFFSWRSGAAFLLHHIVGLAGCALGLYLNKLALFGLAIEVFFEATTPLLHVSC
jgi:hypothetical protein